MRARRHSSYTVITVLLMWLLPLCSVINSGLELLTIPGNAPKISKRWDQNGENNSLSAEREVHHIPPASRHSRHHQIHIVAAIAPPKKTPQPRFAFFADRVAEPPYEGQFPFDTFPEIPVPPPEQAC